MAKLVLTNTSVTLNGTDVSSSIAAITLSTSAAEVPTTNFGSGGAVTRVSGLIFPLVGSTAVTMVVKAGTAAVSTANPSYTFSVLANNWSCVNGAVGELNTADVTWPISGAITKATA